MPGGHRDSSSKPVIGELRFAVLSAFVGQQHRVVAAHRYPAVFGDCLRGRRGAGFGVFRILLDIVVRDAFPPIAGQIDAGLVEAQEVARDGYLHVSPTRIDTPPTVVGQPQLRQVESEFVNQVALPIGPRLRHLGDRAEQADTGLADLGDTHGAEEVRVVLHTRHEAHPSVMRERIAR